MNATRIFSAFLTFALGSATVFAADHPSLGELTPLLARPIDSPEVRALAGKYKLRKAHKFDSGSFTSEDQAYTLMFREDRIDAIILRASPYPKGYGEANWTVYSHPLPRALKATDDRARVEGKLGRPTKPGGDRWVDGRTQLWLHFADKGAAIEEVWVSAAPTAKP